MIASGIKRGDMSGKNKTKRSSRCFSGIYARLRKSDNKMRIGWGVGICLLTITGVWAETMDYLGGIYGSFESPRYPMAYDNNLQRKWQIEVRAGYHIMIQFTDFDLEDSYEEGVGPCVYDYVKIDEGAQTIGRFCGSKNTFPMDAPKPGYWIKTQFNKTIVSFVSDYSNEGITPRGFKAHYVEKDIDECERMKIEEKTIIDDWDKLVTCNHFCHNVPASYYCSCRRGFTLHSNKHTCVAKYCEDMMLVMEMGVIESPDYPSPYAKLSDCTWKIKVRPGLSIHISFDKKFNIEKHDTEGCAYDALAVKRDGKMDTYCGDVAPGDGSSIDMNTNEVTVEFHTDLSVELEGFRLTYTTTRIRCLEEIQTPLNGSISTDESKGYHEFEDVVLFSCDRGFHLIGSAKLECLSDGQWDNQQPTCKIKSCGIPQKLLDSPNSHIIDYDKTKTSYLTTVTVRCDEWYEMTSGTASWICEDSKEWVKNGKPIESNPPNDIPKCTPICGVKGHVHRSLLSQHIAGGTEAFPNEWPWMVFMNFGWEKVLDSRINICAGSLISPHYVLTAAHCVNSTEHPGHIRPANETHVWLAVHNRRNGSSAQYVTAEDIIIHPEYFQSSIWNHDVALVRLTQTIIMSNSIRPVCLPTKEEDFDMVRPGETGEVAGWGLFNNEWRSSYTLLQAEFPIISNEDCWANFVDVSNRTKKPLPKGLKVTDTMFCAGFPTGGQSTCQGDSGGPFVMQKRNTKKYYEVGLVSFGIGALCGRTVTYTGYTRINQDIVDWVMENTDYLN